MPVRFHNTFQASTPWGQQINSALSALFGSGSPGKSALDAAHEGLYDAQAMREMQHAELLGEQARGEARMNELRNPENMLESAFLMSGQDLTPDQRFAKKYGRAPQQPAVAAPPVAPAPVAPVAPAPGPALASPPWPAPLPVGPYTAPAGSGVEVQPLMPMMEPQPTALPYDLPPQTHDARMGAVGGGVEPSADQIAALLAPPAQPEPTGPQGEAVQQSIIDQILAPLRDSVAPSMGALAPGGAQPAPSVPSNEIRQPTEMHPNGFGYYALPDQVESVIYDILGVPKDQVLQEGDVNVEGRSLPVQPFSTARTGIVQGADTPPVAAAAPMPAPARPDIAAPATSRPAAPAPEIRGMLAALTPEPTPGTTPTPAAPNLDKIEQGIKVAAATGQISPDDFRRGMAALAALRMAGMVKHFQPDHVSKAYDDLRAGPTAEAVLSGAMPAGEGASRIAGAMGKPQFDNWAGGTHSLFSGDMKTDPGYEAKANAAAGLDREKVNTEKARQTYLGEAAKYKSEQYRGGPKAGAAGKVEKLTGGELNAGTKMISSGLDAIEAEFNGAKMDAELRRHITSEATKLYKDPESDYYKDAAGALEAVVQKVAPKGWEETGKYNPIEDNHTAPKGGWKKEGAAPADEAAPAPAAAPAKPAAAQPQTVAKPRPEGMSDDEILKWARRSIDQGADAAQVNRWLQQWGVRGGL